MASKLTGARRDGFALCIIEIKNRFSRALECAASRGPPSPSEQQTQVELAFATRSNHYVILCLVSSNKKYNWTSNPRRRRQAAQGVGASCACSTQVEPIYSKRGLFKRAELKHIFFYLPIDNSINLETFIEQYCSNHHVFLYDL